jgi:hypothetical protein
MQLVGASSQLTVDDMANNALQRTGERGGRPVLAKGWRARRGGMGIVPAAERER